MVTGINALAKASLMAQKILNIISLISFVLVAAITGGGIFGYLWLTNEKNQEKLKQQLVEQVTKSIKLPELSSPALPTAQPPQSLSMPKF
tara:strand:- start:235 stop:504 length:270 start_codon:yes stop_codon:yes gene_type:complete